MSHLDKQKISRIGLVVFLLSFLSLSAVVWLAGGGGVAAVYAVAGDELAPAVEALQTTPSIRFTAASVDVDENAGGNGDFQLTLNLQLSIDPNTLTNPVTVTYRTVDGTAQGGSDFVALSDEEIVWQTTDGTNRVKSFTVTILQDTVPEEDETFSVVLQVPENATLGTPNVLEVEINNDDPFPTNTPSSGSPTPIFADVYESNNTIDIATPLEVNSSTFCSSPNATLWPSGDIDFYKFWAKAGSFYTVSSRNLDLGIDTVMTVFNPNGEYVGDNDDFNSERGSTVRFTAHIDGFHYVRIENKDSADPAGKTYCMEVTESIPTATPTVTPFPTSTELPELAQDRCEFNGSFDSACTIGASDPPAAEAFNFVPSEPDAADNDFYRVFVKQGWTYTCETLIAAGSLADTNMIFYDQNQTGLGGNDDKAPDDLGSLLTYTATYDGWLFILVGPFAIPDFLDSPDYTYSLQCAATASTPTPTPTNTFVPVSNPQTGGGNTGGGNTVPPTATPSLPTPTPFPTNDVFATLTAAAPQPTAPSVVIIQPLPTATPDVPVASSAELNVVLYYDANQNFEPELDEGIMDMAVSVYDGVTGDLLSFGYTNEAGMLRFTLVTTSNTLRVSVPFLGFNQTVAAGASEVRLRVVPQVAGGG